MINYKFTLTNANGESIILNDHDTDPNNIIALQEYPQFDVDVKNSELDKEGQHGIWDFFSFFGRRVCSFNGVIVGDNEGDVEDIKTKLLKILSLPTQPSEDDPGITMTWTDANGDDWQITGLKLFRQFSFERGLKDTFRLNFFFSLKSSYPFIESQTENTETGTRGYYDIGGIILPTEIPLSWDITPENVLAINNLGSTDAHSIIRLKGESAGPVTNPRVYNLNTGKYFKVNIILNGTNEWIEIDSKNGTVVDQDGSDVSGLVTADSEFILLRQGSNDILYESDENPYNVLYLPTAEFTVKYRDTKI